MLAEVITPDKTLFKGDVDMVEVPGTKGRFQVLNNHAPIISSLSKGEIIIDKNGKNQQIFSINAGYIEVKENQIVILANVVE